MSKFNDLINGDKPVLVDFHATWCGPCQAMNPVIKDVAKQTKDAAVVIKIDIDKNQNLANSLQIKGVPTFVIYHKGEIKWRASGMQSGTNLIQQLQSLSSQGAR
jgi:thioredoxin 1